jgi:hypothetical protein
MSRRRFQQTVSEFWFWFLLLLLQLLLQMELLLP